ncbi:exodeoxyribonuclease VII large subunit, partial [Aquimarina celericrescens]|nr:exodeoxyribonuclease VII large subunit [Aquimarina celericrescens]
MQIQSLVKFKLKEEQLDLKHQHQEFKTQVNILLQNHRYNLKEQRQRIKSTIPSLLKAKLDGLSRSSYQLSWLSKQ